MKTRILLSTLTSAVVLLSACGNERAPNPPDYSAACNAYADAVFGVCDGPPRPSAEVTRLRGRWLKACNARLSLTGTSLTAERLQGCAQSVHSSGCAALEDPRGPCATASGSLPSNAPCAENAQCQSAECFSHSAPNGGASCGKCIAAAGLGESCEAARCATDAMCARADGSAEWVCLPVVYGAPGVPCGPGMPPCAAGAFCDTGRGVCAAAGAQGAACSTEPECLPPLICALDSTLRTPSTCAAPGQAGAHCTYDVECATGLGCDATAGQCGAVTWVSAGQACGGTVRCLVGTCPYVVNPTCPAVIPDGQACASAGMGPSSGAKTCDTFATCLFNAVCGFTAEGCP
jgi:hypothetical protein